MPGPRRLSEEEEADLVALIKRIGPRAAARERGLSVSLCSRVLARAPQAPPDVSTSAPAAAPAAAPPPPELDPDPIPTDLDDDLEVLKQCRRKAMEQMRHKATGEASRRILALLIATIERLTVRIDKLRRQRTPDRKVGILILPPEGDHLEASIRDALEQLRQERDQARAELADLRRAAG